MYSIEDARGETIVVGNGFVEKLRGGTTSQMRCPIATYSKIESKPQSKRKFLLFGEKEEFVHVIVHAAGFMSLWLPKDREHEVAALREALEREKAQAEAG